MGVDRYDPEVERLVDAEIPLIGVDLDVAGAARELRRLRQRRRRQARGPAPARPRAHAHRDDRRPASDSKPGVGPSGRLSARSCRRSGSRATPGTTQTATSTPRAASGDADAARATRAADGRLRRGRHDGRRRAEAHAREAGLACPEDVAVVGFDDIQLASLIDPPLTTIRQDRVGIGLARRPRARANRSRTPNRRPPR